MEKDLVELFEAVKKAANAAAADSRAETSHEEDSCLDHLERLKRFPVSYQVLLSSQVGKRLRQLTKHPRKRIQALAFDVVETWKISIVEETRKKRKHARIEKEVTVAEFGDSDSGEAKEAPKVTPVTVVNSKNDEPAKGDWYDKNNIHGRSTLIVVKMSSSASMKADRVEGSSAAYAEKMRKSEAFKTEKVIAGEHINVKKLPKQEKRNSGSPKLTSVHYCKDQQREKLREILAESLCKVSCEVDEHVRDEVDACDPYRVAVLLETKMFEKWGSWNGPHNAKYRSIKFNIGDPNNQEFRRKLLLGIFPPHSIVELTAQDMASDARKRQNEKIKEKALFECQRGGPP